MAEPIRFERDGERGTLRIRIDEQYVVPRENDHKRVLGPWERHATDADLRAAGYVPASELDALAGDIERRGIIEEALRKEIDRLRAEVSRLQGENVQRGLAMGQRIEELDHDLREARAKVEALRKGPSVKRTGVEHQLKCLPQYFAAVREGRKTVEIRKDDRGGFAPGDVLILYEWDHKDRYYVGGACRVLVTHALFGAPFVPEGYVALSIRLID